MSVVQFLVEKGANVNVKSKSGETPLGVARRKSHSDIVEFLEGHDGRE